ncbi:MAG TPA: HDOD domain-containing protein [Polyangia bacterium]
MSGTASAKLSTSILEELWFGEDDPKASDEAAASSLAAKLAELEGLRPFPAIVQRVMEYVNRPDFDARKLETMIEEDPALAAKVLRVANSAAFAGSQPVPTIRDAAVRLGARQISDVAASIAAMAMFKDVKGVGRVVRDHMVTTAMLVRVLGSRKERASSSGYLTGLLHDMGKLLLLQTEDAAYEATLSKVSTPDEVHIQERELLGFDHAVLGGHVLKMWGLPDPIPQVVAWHHQPVRAYEEGGEVGLTVALIRIADQIEPLLRAHAGLDNQQLKRIIASSDCAHAGLRERDFVALWTDLEDAHRNALKLFA